MDEVFASRRDVTRADCGLTNRAMRLLLFSLISVGLLLLGCSSAQSDANRAVKSEADVAPANPPAGENPAATLPPHRVKMAFYRPDAKNLRPTRDPSTGNTDDKPPIQGETRTDLVMKAMDNGPNISMLRAVADNSTTPVQKPEINNIQNTPSAVKTESSNVLDIKIETSRQQPTVGSGLGIQAAITNTSNTNVYLKESSTILVVPPELVDPVGLTSYQWAVFPTNHKSPTSKDDPPDAATILIKPGSIYFVEWINGPYDNNNNLTPWGFVYTISQIVQDELHYTFFNPGEYQLSVVAQFWTTPELNADEYRTATKTATVRIAAPQSVILLGAAIGGLIGFFIFPVRTPDTQAEDTGIFPLLRMFGGGSLYLAKLLAAMLLSMIVTILLARISETQFLVRVTVADFWGAIAVGFIANYAGVKIFQSMKLPGGGGGNTEGNNPNSGGGGAGGIPPAAAVPAAAAPAAAGGPPAPIPAAEPANMPQAAAAGPANAAPQLGVIPHN
jgi:hypothetical protein